MRNLQQQRKEARQQPEALRSNAIRTEAPIEFEFDAPEKNADQKAAEQARSAIIRATAPRAFPTF